MQTAPHARHIVGRYLQCLVVGKGSPGAAIAFAESQNWLDRSQVIASLKSAVGAMGTSGDALASNPVGDAFLAAMRGTSIPLRLENMKRVPMLTRLYIASSGVAVGEVTEGSSIPLVRGNWTAATLSPRKFSGILVQTEELVQSMSPTASLALTGDLADGTSQAENYAFVSPDVAGSVLFGAPTFAGTGTGAANVDSDLKQLVGLVAGASRPGAAFVMTSETATALATIRGTGGAVAYPDIGPQGGELLHLPVLITSACAIAGSPATRVIGLISPSDIFWADDGRVELTIAADATLEMTDGPSGNSLTPTPSQMVSMFQTGSVALRAIRESAWYARAGAGAYFVAGY